MRESWMRKRGILRERRHEMSGRRRRRIRGWFGRRWKVSCLSERRRPGSKDRKEESVYIYLLSKTELRLTKPTPRSTAKVSSSSSP